MWVIDWSRKRPFVSRLTKEDNQTKKNDIFGKPMLVFLTKKDAEEHLQKLLRDSKRMRLKG